MFCDMLMFKRMLEVVSENLSKHVESHPMEWTTNDSLDELIRHRASFILSQSDDDDFCYEYEIETDKAKDKWCRLGVEISTLEYSTTYMISEQTGFVPPLEDMKRVAEEHRIDTICRMLGIKD